MISSILKTKKPLVFQTAFKLFFGGDGENWTARPAKYKNLSFSTYLVAIMFYTFKGCLQTTSLLVSFLIFALYKNLNWKRNFHEVWCLEKFREFFFKASCLNCYSQVCFRIICVYFFPVFKVIPDLPYALHKFRHSPSKPFRPQSLWIYCLVLSCLVLPCFVLFWLVLFCFVLCFVFAGVLFGFYTSKMISFAFIYRFIYILITYML